MYSTYGQRTVTAGEGNSPLGYCARDGVLTEQTGLLYMRARYYNPELMRFINEDIIVGDISNSNSLNRYAYVGGNPVTMVDPFGLCPDGNKKEKSKCDIRVEQGAACLKNLVLEVCEIVFAVCSLTGGVTAVFFVPEMAYVVANHSEGSQHMENLINGVEEHVHNWLLEEVYKGDRFTYDQYEFLIPRLIKGTLDIEDAINYVKNSISSNLWSVKSSSQGSTYSIPKTIKDVEVPMLPEGSQWERNVLNSFAGGNTNLVTYKGGTVLYRVGGNNGGFWSLDAPPATEYQWRVDYAIKQEFCNDASTLFKITIPEGASLSGIEGIVGSQGMGLYGGAHQVYIDYLAVPEDWIETFEMIWK